MADRKLVGKVIDRGGKPVRGAEYWLSRSGGTPLTGTTTDAGEIDVDLSDAEAWPEGTVSLGVRPPDSPLTERRQIELPEEGSPPYQLVKVHARNEISFAWGLAFLGAAILALVLFGYKYLDLHGVTVEKLERRESIADERTSEISEPLADVLAIARKQVAVAGQVLAAADPVPAAEGEPVEAEPVEAEPGEDAQAEDEEAEEDENGGASPNPGTRALRDARVDDSLETAREIFAELQKSRAGLLDHDKIQAIDGLFAQADSALEAGDVDGLDETLGDLSNEIIDERTSFLWEESPGRLFEVMFWALAATLMRLIFNAGYYLYKSRFLKTAIPHHLALAVIIPVVAVIVSFVLMLVRIDLQLGENTVVLDMDNVLLAVLVAAFIGLAPWESWNLLHKLADLFFRTLAKYFGFGSGDSAESG